MNIPKHIAIILDGNGRWAKKRGLPRSAGHTAGAKRFREIAKYCNQIGIKYLTVYAFSTENFKRDKSEVDYLMNLFINCFDMNPRIYHILFARILERLIIHYSLLMMRLILYIDL